MTLAPLRYHFHPLPIHLNAGATIHLQQSVEGWSAQAMAKYALCQEPQILCLQLLRFKQQGEAVNKDVRPLEGLFRRDTLPGFHGDPHLAYCPEAISGCSRPTSLWGNAGDRTLSCVAMWSKDVCKWSLFWLTDDACRAQPSDPCTHSTAAYLVWLRQVSADAVAVGG